MAARGFVAQVLPSETKRTRGRTEGVRVQSRDARFNSIEPHHRPRFFSMPFHVIQSGSTQGSVYGSASCSFLELWVVCRRHR